MNLTNIDILSFCYGIVAAFIPIGIYLLLTKVFRPKPKAPEKIANEILKANKTLVDAFKTQNKVNEWMYTWFKELEGGKANE